MTESLDGEGVKLLRFAAIVRRALAIALVTSQVAVLAAGISALASRRAQAAGANPLYTGPVNGADTTYGGAILTGSYDGAVSVTNDDDFTAVAIPTGTTQLVNLSTIPGSPQGNAFTLASPIAIQVPHSFYYDDTNNPKNHVITFVAQAPTGWTTEICADSYTNGYYNAGGTGPPPPTSPNCSDNNPGVTCNATNFSGPIDDWIVAGTAGTVGNQFQATYCVPRASGPFFDWYWVIYTIPAGTSLTAFQRYDGSISATATLPASANSTHDELYPGFIALTKSESVAVPGCPSGVTPSYLGQPICPGGILRYSIDYRNIVLGGGQGTEGQLASLFPESRAGTLAITDDGTQNATSQQTISNWAAFSKGLYAALSAGLSTNAACGTTPASACGDTTAGTTFAYAGGQPSGVGATKFIATVGGSAFQLYPSGFAGQTSQGSITFAVQVQ
ncbi:MAG: hypothetical protein ACYDEW_01495 [Vulcanimicrobiaceae bacterium]